MDDTRCLSKNSQFCLTLRMLKICRSWKSRAEQQLKAKSKHLLSCEHAVFTQNQYKVLIITVSAHIRFQITINVIRELRGQKVGGGGCRLYRMKKIMKCFKKNYWKKVPWENHFRDIHYLFIKYSHCWCNVVGA